VAWLAALGLALAACGSADRDEPMAEPDPAEVVDELAVTPIEETGGTTADATEVLDRALAQLGTGYRFAADMTTAGGGQIAIDGHRMGEAMAFQLTVGDLTIETIARDGTLWTRPLGDDQWASDAWTTAADPLAPLRRPLRVTTDGDADRLVATYRGAALGLGVDDMVDVQVNLADGEVRFSTDSEDVRMVSVLAADESLPAIVAPD
jgi:hypothetical protein